jgi:hypothetical protein
VEGRNNFLAITHGRRIILVPFFVRFFFGWGVYFSDFTVVTFCGFGEVVFVFGHLFFIGETNSVDSLHGIILGITKPVCCGILL